MVRGIKTLCGRTKLKWWIPYGTVITRGPGILGFKSAGGKEDLDEIVQDSEGQKTGESEIMNNKERGGGKEKTLKE